jgi:hypothetical protein
MRQDKQMAAIDHLQTSIGQATGQDPAVRGWHNGVIRAHHDEDRQLELRQP